MNIPHFSLAVYSFGGDCPDEYADTPETINALLAQVPDGSVGDLNIGLFTNAVNVTMPRNGRTKPMNVERTAELFVCGGHGRKIISIADYQSFRATVLAVHEETSAQDKMQNLSIGK